MQQLPVKWPRGAGNIWGTLRTQQSVMVLTGGLSCQGSDAQSPGRGGRFLPRRSPTLLYQILICHRGHQLPDKDSLQASIINAFPQPPPAWEPCRSEKQLLHHQYFTRLNQNF